MANLYNKNPEEKANKIVVDTESKPAQSSAVGKIFWYILFILIIPLIIHIKNRNDLMRKQTKINELSGQIDTQLVRRRDVLVKLFETTKGYAKHEKETLAEVTKMRNMQVVNNREEATELANSVFGRLFAVSENFPDLKADRHFAGLMDEITNSENQIAATRRFYNSEVNSYNQMLFTWPTNVAASAMSLSSISVFAASPEQKADINIKF
ncbi:LemA family [Mycoplasmopsis californica]|uniref:LemA family protein n=1 Tax=Mycoplasmopsis equigenitalium TaxID=114883 RepID=A0ABY5J2U5_9BACT|nr:LemA family protein [Mycoplasmopsis equigenitalium]UUD36851.1 LemA family protein [Mycoplasmopsis equigenitalium]VEU69853.1 LemA family [Mycoplasmopsis californica]